MNEEECNKFAIEKMSTWNCYWVEEECRKFESISCADYGNNEAICLEAKCIYNGGECLAKVSECKELVTPSACNYALVTPVIESEMICQWVDNGCVQVMNKACTQVISPELCEQARLVNRVKCVWYNNQCADLNCTLYT